jgi:hypothetical protein
LATGETRPDPQDTRRLFTVAQDLSYRLLSSALARVILLKGFSLPAIARRRFPG